MSTPREATYRCGAETSEGKKEDENAAEANHELLTGNILKQ